MQTYAIGFGCFGHSQMNLWRELLAKKRTSTLLAVGNIITDFKMPIHF